MGRKTPRRIYALFRTTASEPGRILLASQIGVGQKI